MADSTASARRRRTQPPEGGTLRDEQRRGTRQKLAEAALALFEEHGYGAVTAEAIAKRAGANRATFYLHYAGKADVVLELMDGLDAETMGIFAAADALVDPTPADVRAWLEDAVGYWERHRALIEANQQAMPVERRVADRWWDGLERMVDAMPRTLEGHAGADLARERMRIHGLLLQLERFCYFLVIAREPLDRDVLLDVLTEQWHALLTRS